MDYEAQIQQWADRVTDAHQVLDALLGLDEATLDVAEFYAGSYARFQLERVYVALWRDGQFGAARACRAQIEALVAFERQRLATREG